MSKVQEFIDKVHSRRSAELEQGIESYEVRMWMALAEALEELQAHSHATLSVIGGPLPSGDDSALRSGGQTYETGPRPRISVPRSRASLFSESE
jgi:hypothetical protein